jgi:hypothetical protein
MVERNDITLDYE